MINLSTTQIDEALAGTPYQCGILDVHHHEGKDMYYLTYDNAGIKLAENAKENAARAILLERLCGELVKTMNMYANNQGDGWPMSSDDAEKLTAQARELGIGE